MKLKKEKISRLSGIDDVTVCDLTDSTNTQAKRLAREGAPLPLLFCSEAQTAGRGRLGRSFYSPPESGLYMSLAFRSDKEMSDAVTLTSAAAVAVCRSLEELGVGNALIKWVNDIYIDHKKVCGILCEAVHLEKTVIIIGIGINCTTKDFPEDISSVAGSVGSLDRSTLAASVAKKLLDYKDNAESRPWMDEYRGRSLVLGENINYTENGITRSARAVDIDANGGLMVEEKGEIKTLSTGEITVRLRKD